MLNKAQIIGRVGKDPEVRYLPNGDAVANLSVATTETWKDKNGNKQESTEWHRVNFFGKLAEIVGEYVKKGALIYVEGKIKTRKWTDKDGIDKYQTEITANEMKMLGSKSDTGQSESSQPAPRANQARQSPASTNNNVADLDDDIPF